MGCCVVFLGMWLWFVIVWLVVMVVILGDCVICFVLCGDLIGLVFWLLV